MKWIKKIFSKNNIPNEFKAPIFCIANFEQSINDSINEILKFAFPSHLSHLPPRELLSVLFYLFEALTKKFKSRNFRIKSVKKDISFLCAYATMMLNNLPNGLDNYNEDGHNFQVVISLTLDKIKELLIKKNQLYKNNYMKNWPNGVLYRLDDKLSRLQNAIEIMNKKEIHFETVEDNLMDIIGYSILLFKTLKDIENGKTYF